MNQHLISLDMLQALGLLQSVFEPRMVNRHLDPQSLLRMSQDVIQKTQTVSLKAFTLFQDLLTRSPGDVLRIQVVIQHLMDMEAKAQQETDLKLVGIMYRVLY